jgi:hypothetical protein
VQTVKIKPPLALTAARVEPELEGETWRDVATYALQLKQWGGACEADKSSVRSWADE